METRSRSEFVRILALAIHSAHERGIVHRDLKPANILLDCVANPSGDPYSLEIPSIGTVRPKITDFGIAKWKGVDLTMTESGRFLGTPSFAAPELFLQGSGAATPASDIYSLGAIFYQLLTGQTPHEEDVVNLTKKHQKGDSEVAPPRSVNPVIPSDLEAICLTALAPEPETRYESACGVRSRPGKLLKWQAHAGAISGTLGTVNEPSWLEPSTVSFSKLATGDFHRCSHWWRDYDDLLYAPASTCSQLVGGSSRLLRLCACGSFGHVGLVVAAEERRSKGNLRDHHHYSRLMVSDYGLRKNL